MSDRNVECTLISLMGSAVGSAIGASITQSISNGKIGLLVVVGIIIGAWSGSYIAYSIKKPRSDWSMNNEGTVFAMPIFGAGIGLMLLILIR